MAVGLIYQGQFEFPQKKFFWCLSGDFNFAQMPELNDQHAEFVNRAGDYFMGEPNRNLKPKAEGEDPEQPPAEEPEEGAEGAEADNASNVSQEEELKADVKELHEIDRLNYVVHAIENDCQIAPIGAFKMTSEHQVRRNEAFKGLDAGAALQLSSYQHFRNVQTAEKKKALDAAGIAFTHDFLESIADDKPHRCWNFQQNLNGKTVLGRSLLWPGYNFYTNVNSNKFGSIYIGEGLKNLELQFMTQ